MFRNKQGFILYDALISLLLLSSITILYTNMIKINTENTIKINQSIEVINYLRNGIYHDENITNNGKYKTYEKGKYYCAATTKGKYEKCI